MSRLLIPPNSPIPFTLSYIVTTMTDYSVSTYSVAEIRPLSNLKLRVTMEGSVSSGGISRTIEMLIKPPLFNTMVTIFSNSAYRYASTLTEYYAKRRRFLWIWWGWNDYHVASNTSPIAPSFSLCVVPSTTVPFPWSHHYHLLPFIFTFHIPYLICSFHICYIIFNPFR